MVSDEDNGQRLGDLCCCTETGPSLGPDAMGNKYSDQPVETGSRAEVGTAHKAEGLSQREQKAIRMSWKKISSELKINGRDFFVKFFEFYPVYIDYFPAFRGKTIEELCCTPLVQAHGISVMYSFTTLVENLNDPDFFNKFMTRNMRAHEGRGVALQQYEEIFEVLILFLEEKLGARFDVFTRSAWGHFAEEFSEAVMNLEGCDTVFD